MVFLTGSVEGVKWFCVRVASAWREKGKEPGFPDCRVEGPGGKDVREPPLRCNFSPLGQREEQGCDQRLGERRDVEDGREARLPGCDVAHDFLSPGRGEGGRRVRLPADPILQQFFRLPEKAP